jgi:hypothetical protein
MYELKKKLERYLRVNLLGLDPRLMKKRIYRAAVSQKLRNIAVHVSNRLTMHRCEVALLYMQHMVFIIPPRSSWQLVNVDAQ